MSPFKSIRATAKDSTFLGNLVGERFPNNKLIPNIKSPILFIHGTADRVINHSHSRGLFESATGASFKMLKLCPGMGHNNYNMQHDIVGNIEEFLVAIEFVRYKHDQLIDPGTFLNFKKIP
jgi:pimeloyl-ACP methyl ester carboxylesterase